MADSNQFLPVFVATGVAVLGCAAAFYFSDSDTSTKRRKQFPIHTNDFDDELDSYRGDYPTSVKHNKRKYPRMDHGNDRDDDIDGDDDDDDDDDEDDVEDDDDDDDDDVDDDEEEDGEPYLVNKRVKKTKASKSRRH